VTCLHLDMCGVPQRMSAVAFASGVLALYEKGLVDENVFSHILPLAASDLPKNDVGASVDWDGGSGVGSTAGRGLRGEGLVGDVRCICIYVCMCIYIHIHIHVYVQAFIYVYIFKYVYVYTCIHIYMCIDTYLCASTCINIYACIGVCSLHLNDARYFKCGALQWAVRIHSYVYVHV